MTGERGTSGRFLRARAPEHGSSGSTTTARLQFVELEPDELDLLLRIYQAERRWADDGHDDRTFLLIPRGGMRRDLDHPGWDEAWPVPTTRQIDDLEEHGLLRVAVHAPNRTDRTFELSTEGRRVARSLAAEPHLADSAPSACRHLRRMTYLHGSPALTKAHGPTVNVSLRPQSPGSALLRLRLSVRCCSTLRRNASLGSSTPWLRSANGQRRHGSGRQASFGSPSPGATASRARWALRRHPPTTSATSVSLPARHRQPDHDHSGDRGACASRGRSAV